MVSARVRCAALAMLAASVLVACNQSPRTQVMVVVDTDLRGPTGIDNVIATVIGPDGATQMSLATVGAGEPGWPRTLGLVWDGGRLGPFTVRLTGNRGGALLVERTARFSFQEGRTLVLRMDLLARCMGESCGSGQTCGESGCRSVEVDPSELTEWTGTPPALDVDAGPAPDAGAPVDSGTMPVDGGAPVDAGACVPSAEVCNGMDDDCDSMVDEGFDLDADEANCGACGRTCDFANATGECTAGECTISACDTGFEDCNSMGADGCEAELATDEMNCGGCGMRCNTGPARTCCAGMCERTCP